MKKFLFCLSAFTLMLSCGATEKTIENVKPIVQENSSYWQQHVDYSMEIDMDVNSYQYQGKQKLVYTNNSPDVLNRVY